MLFHYQFLHRITLLQTLSQPASLPWFSSITRLPSLSLILILSNSYHLPKDTWVVASNFGNTGATCWRISAYYGPSLETGLLSASQSPWFKPCEHLIHPGSVWYLKARTRMGVNIYTTFTVQWDPKVLNVHSAVCPSQVALNYSSTLRDDYKTSIINRNRWGNLKKSLEKIEKPMPSSS